MSNNRVNITIGNQSYTLIAKEDAAYIQQLASYVNDELRKVAGDGHLSIADSAVLTSMNVADSLFKEREASDNLRQQIKSNLEESAQMKLELAEAKREIFRLQNRKG